MNPLAFLTPYKYVLDAILIAALIAGACWLRHWDTTNQQAIGANRVQLAWDQQRLIDAQAAAETKARYQKEKDDAVAQAVKNAQLSAAAADAAVKSSGVLSGTIKTILDNSTTATADADRRYIAALGAVVNSCKEEYRQLGAAADKLNNDKQTLINAWPH